MKFRSKVFSSYEVVASENVAALAKSLLAEFFPNYNVPQPNIKVVNHTGSPWLGRCRFDRKNDKTSTIQIQKSVMGDKESLKRILLHELVHHVDFLVNTINLDRFSFKRYDGHGMWFKEQADRINSKMGEGYVSQESDANIVVERNQNPFYVLIMPSFSYKDRLGFSYAVRPSARQKEYLVRLLESNDKARLVKSKDEKWTTGAAIGGRTISMPRDPDMVEALKRLYEEGERVTSL